MRNSRLRIAPPLCTPPSASPAVLYKVSVRLFIFVVAAAFPTDPIAPTVEWGGFAVRQSGIHYIIYKTPGQDHSCPGL